MLARLATLFTLLFVLATPANAQAVNILTVDYSRAIQEIDEGKAAKDRLDKMYEGRKAEIQNAEAELEALTKEYQAKASVLSEQARQEFEQRIYTKQMEYQQLYANADAEFQQAYMSSMERLMKGLAEVAGTIGKERNADLVLETSQGSVLYAKPGLDITDEVIKRYNTTH